MEARLFGTLGGLVQRNLEETYKFGLKSISSGTALISMKLHPPRPFPHPCTICRQHPERYPHIATGESAGYGNPWRHLRRGGDSRWNQARAEWMALKGRAAIATCNLGGSVLAELPRKI
jgi:hypothetical protein